MNSFRSALDKGSAGKPAGPLMPAKKPKGVTEELGSIAVARDARRTANHREDDRHRLVTERVNMKAGRKTYEVDLINLSGGGAMVSTDAPLDMWQKVDLQLGDCDSLECAVRWVRGDRVGLEFAHETQIGGDPAKRDAMLLAVLKRSFPDAKAPSRSAEPANPVKAAPIPKQRRTALRHPLIWSGNILYNHESIRVRLRNISESGALVDSDVPFPPQAEVMLDLGGAGQVFATVGWSRGDQVGLKFVEPFDISRLAQLKPEVSDHRWSRPDYLSGANADDGDWAEDWKAGSISEIRDDLEGYLKR